MAIEVFWGSGSPFAWRVLLMLEIKRVGYESRLIEFSKQQHKAPEFLALNPRGKVPVMRDGDYVLSESLAIMAYLERQFPEPALFGRSAEETGRIWKSLSDGFSYVEPLMARIIGPVFFGGVAEKADDIRAAADGVRTELGTLNGTLGRQPWLAGGAMSAADIALYPWVELLLRAAGREAAAPLDLGLLPFDSRFPALQAWRGKFRALPGYNRTYPPHWRAAA